MTEKEPHQSPVLLDLTRDQLHDIFRALVLARAAEERLEVLFQRIRGGEADAAAALDSLWAQAHPYTQ